MRVPFEMSEAEGRAEFDALFFPAIALPRELGACPICDRTICGHGRAQRLSAALAKATYERPRAR